jgi:hypothetical protein
VHRIMLAAVSVLADDAPRRTGPDFGKASPLGLLVVVLLLIATFFLIRSMNRHLNKLPESFDPAHPRQDQAADEGTVELDGGAPPAWGGPTDPTGPTREPDR